MNKDKLEQLLEREAELLYQINNTTKWSGAMFCTSQMEELNRIRNRIAELKEQYAFCATIAKA